jgi:hypothetical protein
MSPPCLRTASVPLRCGVVASFHSPVVPIELGEVEIAVRNLDPRGADAHAGACDFEMSRCGETRRPGAAALERIERAFPGQLLDIAQLARHVESAAH